MTSPSNHCRTCGKDAKWHRDNSPIHAFNGGSVPTSQTFSPPEPQQGVDVQVSPPLHGMFDPVLRQALVDKGIITPDDLRAAEDKIRAVTNTFTLGGRNGEG
jgi:hypothetical protein